MTGAVALNAVHSSDEATKTSQNVTPSRLDRDVVLIGSTPRSIHPR
jgi:hypothetical protein